MNSLKYFILITDIGFILYWTIVLFQLLPENYLFMTNDDTMTKSWNLSFLPLHLIVVITGLHSLYLNKYEIKQWRYFALISLALTSFLAVQTLVFWILMNHFDLFWWIPNGLMLILPLFFIKRIMKTKKETEFYSYFPNQYRNS